MSSFGAKADIQRFSIQGLVFQHGNSIIANSNFTHVSYSNMLRTYLIGFNDSKLPAK